MAYPSKPEILITQDDFEKLQQLNGCSHPAVQQLLSRVKIFNNSSDLQKLEQQLKHSKPKKWKVVLKAIGSFVLGFLGSWVVHAVSMLFHSSFTIAGFTLALCCPMGIGMSLMVGLIIGGVTLYVRVREYCQMDTLITGIQQLLNDYRTEFNQLVNDTKTQMTELMEQQEVRMTQFESKCREVEQRYAQLLQRSLSDYEQLLQEFENYKHCAAVAERMHQTELERIQEEGNAFQQQQVEELKDHYLEMFRQQEERFLALRSQLEDQQQKACNQEAAAKIQELHDHYLEFYRQQEIRFLQRQQELQAAGGNTTAHLKLEELAQLIQCDVCECREKDTVLLPCCHTTCAACAASWASAHMTCPFCRRNIDDWKPLYGFVQPV